MRSVPDVLDQELLDVLCNQSNIFLRKSPITIRWLIISALPLDARFNPAHICCFTSHTIIISVFLFSELLKMLLTF